MLEKEFQLSPALMSLLKLNFEQPANGWWVEGSTPDKIIFLGMHVIVEKKVHLSQQCFSYFYPLAE